MYGLIPVVMFVFLLSIPVLETLIPLRWSVSFPCPEGRGKVDAVFVGRESLGVSTAVDVCACSAVADMRVAACSRRCLKLSVARTGPVLSEPFPV